MNIPNQATSFYCNKKINREEKFYYIFWLNWFNPILFQLGNVVWVNVDIVILELDNDAQSICMGCASYITCFQAQCAKSLPMPFNRVFYNAASATYMYLHNLCFHYIGFLQPRWCETSDIAKKVIFSFNSILYQY